MANIKWIKLSTSMFDNRKIKQIESLPNGDSIIVVWVKLLCLAGEINDGGMVYFTKEIPYTDQMLAQQFNKPLPTIQMALGVFQQFGMIEVIDDIMHISNWEKYQNVEGMERIKEQNRKRAAAYRERQKQKLLAGETEKHSDTKSNVIVTLHHGTDIDIDIDKDKDIYISIVDYLNEKAGTKYRASSKKTQSSIHARLAEGYTLEDFKTVIDKKCADWLGTEWEQYLRPSTLFGTKFEQYLNAKITKQLVNAIPSEEDPLDGLF